MEQFINSIENRFYANNAGGRGMVDSVVSGYDLEMISFFLNWRGAEKIIADSYFCAIGHTDLKADFDEIDGFKPFYRYGADENVIHKSEYGTFGDIKFFASPEIKPFLESGALSPVLLSNYECPAEGLPPACDVYPVLFCGNNAFGKWRFNGLQVLMQSHIAILEVGCSAYPGYRDYYN